MMRLRSDSEMHTLHTMRLEPLLLLVNLANLATPPVTSPVTVTMRPVLLSGALSCRLSVLILAHPYSSSAAASAASAASAWTASAYSDTPLSGGLLLVDGLSSGLHEEVLGVGVRLFFGQRSEACSLAWRLPV